MQTTTETETLPETVDHTRFPFEITLPELADPRTPYEQVCALARKLQAIGLLQAYVTDLTKHDRAELDGYDGEFLWAVRDGGTTLWTRDGYRTSSEAGWRKHEEAAECYLDGSLSCRTQLYYYRPGVGLTRIVAVVDVWRIFQGWREGTYTPKHWTL
jgi:hypothetical protein